MRIPVKPVLLVFISTLVIVSAASQRSEASTCSAEVIVDLQKDYGDRFGNYRPTNNKDAHFIKYLIRENRQLKKQVDDLRSEVRGLERMITVLEATVNDPRREVSVKCDCTAFHPAHGTVDFGPAYGSAHSFGQAAIEAGQWCNDQETLFGSVTRRKGTASNCQEVK